MQKELDELGYQCKGKGIKNMYIDSNEAGLEMQQIDVKQHIMERNIYTLFINDITTFIADYVKGNKRFTCTQEEIK